MKLKQNSWSLSVRHNSSQALEHLWIQVSRGFCTQSFIVSISRKEFSTNLASQCTVVCTANHGGTSQISVYQCQTSQHGSIFDPLLGVSWWFRLRDAGSAHSVHRPSLWLARRFGTLYQTAWEIRILAGTASDVCRRRIYLQCTEAFSVLEKFQDDMLYRLTYLLTYFSMRCV